MEELRKTPLPSNEPAKKNTPLIIANVQPQPPKVLADGTIRAVLDLIDRSPELVAYLYQASLEPDHVMVIMNKQDAISHGFMK